GLRSEDENVDLRPENAFTVAIQRTAGKGAEQVVPNMADLLHRVLKGHVRGRSMQGKDAWGTACTDLLTHAAGELLDPGDDVPVDVALLCAPLDCLTERVERLVQGGALVVESALDDNEVWASLPQSVQAIVRDKQLVLFKTTPEQQETEVERSERLLGALVSALVGQKKCEVKTTRIFSAREDVLGNSNDAEAQARIAALKNGLDNLRRLSADEVSNQAKERQAPLAVRHMAPKQGGGESTIEDLPRFWNQVGVLYEANETRELSVDPYLASGVIPPLSSTFRDFTGVREFFPEFDPLKCNGCGRCWVACPDSAIGAVAIEVQALVEAGMGLAQARGGQVDSLRQVLSKLGPFACAAFAKADPLPTTVGALLEQPFQDLLERMSLPDDRKGPMQTAFKAVIQEVGELHVARTEAFFKEPEKNKKGAGELFSLVVNPDTCKGCMSCVSACEAGALVAHPGNESRTQNARRLWNLYEALPDTKGETIARVRGHHDVGELPAMMMSGHCQGALAGGDGVEPGSGAKLILRLCLGVAEYELQRRLQEHLKDVKDVQEQLAAQIKETFVRALPTENLGDLSGGLDSLGKSSAKLGELVAHLEKAGKSKSVNVPRLQKLVALSQDLAGLQWRISEGKFGLGRSRLGLVFCPDALSRGIGSFPYNPFQVPAVFDDSGEGAGLARGLLEGQLQEVMEGVRLLRRARMELENPTEAALVGPALKLLSWVELTEQERCICPPVLLVGNSQAFDDQSLSSLLDSDLPVKVLVFGDAGAGVANSRQILVATGRNELGLLALSYGRAFVVQSSISHPQHLAAGLSRALTYAGPALIHVCAPSPKEHGFAVDRALEHAHLAVDSRAFPLFIFDPSKDGVFGTCLDLRENPALNETWNAAKDGTLLTPAHWALTEERFAEHFGLLTANAQNPMALAEYLVLPPRERREKTPFVEIPGEEKKRLSISPALVVMAEKRILVWRTLQELGGVVTPFTAHVRAEAEKTVATEREQ
ncbi:MAG: 4Fe-4S binding protein, partial [Pseudomonadota bacterium]